MFSTNTNTSTYMYSTNTNTSTNTNALSDRVRFYKVSETLLCSRTRLLFPVFAQVVVRVETAMDLELVNSRCDIVRLTQSPIRYPYQRFRFFEQPIILSKSLIYMMI